MEEESGKGVYQSEGMKPEEGKSVESTDRGLFDFMKKKEDNQMASEFENKVHVSSEAGEDHPKKKHEGLVEKIHHSDGSSSSSSDEGEGDDNDEKRRRKKEKKEKKKGLKEKIMEKLPGHEDEEKTEHQHHHHKEETNVPVEKVYEELHSSQTNKPQKAEEKKGFLDRIKEKLPGQQKKADEHEHEHEHAHEVAPAAAEHHEGKEKKGILEKIKEKIPAFHSKNAAEEKRDTTH